MGMAHLLWWCCPNSTPRGLAAQELALPEEVDALDVDETGALQPRGLWTCHQRGAQQSPMPPGPHHSSLDAKPLKFPSQEIKAWLLVARYTFRNQLIGVEYDASGPGCEAHVETYSEIPNSSC